MSEPTPADETADEFDGWRKPTTAERLVEYGADLLTAGFPADTVKEMLCRAAAHPDDFVTKADQKRAAWRVQQELQATLMMMRLSFGIKDDREEAPTDSPARQPRGLAALWRGRWTDA